MTRAGERPGYDCFVADFDLLDGVATLDALVLETGLCERQVLRYLAQLHADGRLVKLDGTGEEIPFHTRVFSETMTYRLLRARQRANDRSSTAAEKTRGAIPTRS